MVDIIFGLMLVASVGVMSWGVGRVFERNATTPRVLQGLFMCAVGALAANVWLGALVR